MAKLQGTLSPKWLPRAAVTCVEAGWLTVVVLVPLAINPWSFHYELTKAALFRGIALLMLAAHLLTQAWAPRPADLGRWFDRPLVRPILLVAGVVLLSALASPGPVTSLWGSYQRQQGAYLLLAFALWALLLALHIQTPTQRHRLATVIVVTGSLVALTPFAEALLRAKSPLTWRPGGSLGNSIFLGAYLIMVIPFTLAHAISNSSSRNPHSQIRNRFGWGVALALQLFALLVTQSRGPWVGALAGLAVFATLMFWQTHRRLVLVGLIAAPLVIGGLVAGLNFGLAPSTRLARLPYVRRVILPEGLSGGTVRVRLVLWRAAAEVVTRWPEVGLSPDQLHGLRPVLGYGPDAAFSAYTFVYPPELAHIEDPDDLWDRAHNETLDLLAMQGWLGIAVTLVLGITCARRGLAQWRAADDVVGRAWAAAPLAALTAHIVETQFAFTLTATGMMSWLCVAWLASDSSLSPTCQGEGTPVPRQRVYAIVGALLLVLVATRLEGGNLWADVLVGRARALDRADQWGESIALYNQALALIPWQATYHQSRAEVFYNLARALPEDETTLQGELLASADRGLARARQLEPLELEHHSNGGVLHAYWSETLDPTHLETAINFYRQALLLAPTRAELRTDLGHVYHNHGRYEDALAEYRAALEIDPLFAAAHYDSGLAWLALGDQGLARGAFQAALALAPGCAACQDELEALWE